MPRHIDPEDIVGQKFGKLIVIECLGKDQYDCKHPWLYQCKCECGNVVVIRRNNLITGMTKSCGCTKGQRKQKTAPIVFKDKHPVVFNPKLSPDFKLKAKDGKEIKPFRQSQLKDVPSSSDDIVGLKFGKLTVEKYVGFQTQPSGKRRHMYQCVCECGKTRLCERSNLLNGISKSCGCLRKENCRKDDSTSYTKKEVKPERIEKPNKKEIEPKWIEKPKKQLPFPDDIIGDTEGSLTCIKRLYRAKDRNWIYLVKCENCGHEFELDRGNFLLGKTHCPNCYRPYTKPKKQKKPEIPKKKVNYRIDPQDIVGQRFGKLTVLKHLGTYGKKYNHRYLCQCDCGNQKILRRDNLLNGTIRSCGCMQGKKF